MKKVLKHAAGIDVAQDELVVSLGRIDEDMAIEIYGYKVFSNDTKGFTTLLLWVNKLAGEGNAVCFVMEATGIYHEQLAYFLDDRGLAVSIVLPNKMSNYFKTLETKTITDKTASEAIAKFGLERKLDRWVRPKEVYKRLRQLSRERGQIVELRTMAKNQLHAESAGAEPHNSSLARIEKHIAFLDAQEKEIVGEIRGLIQNDADVQKIVLLICSIPGVGLLTAAAVLAETNGFDLIKNKKQLTSYAGLDVKEKQSGTSVKGKPRISKKGNKHLRKAMHLPALTAIRLDENFKALFIRLVQKHGIKMKAVVAVQRKLLEMIYTVYKTNTKYDKEYLQKKENDALEKQNKKVA